MWSGLTNSLRYPLDIHLMIAQPGSGVGLLVVTVLIVGLILCRGRHTVTAVLRAVGPLAGWHFSSYHRVFSRASWSTWVLGLFSVASLAFHAHTRRHKVSPACWP